MIKEKLKPLIALCLLITAVGTLLLVFSVNIGISMGENWLFKKGGADTSVYLKVIDGYTNSFLAAGSVLLSIGLIALLFIYYKILINND